MAVVHPSLPAEAPKAKTILTNEPPTSTTLQHEMEPRFSLPPHTPRSSRTELVIGGVQIYVYGLEELKQKSGVEVAVLYLAHQRTRTYLVTEEIAHEVLHRYRSGTRRKRVELIAVTMNMRNHGDRLVSDYICAFMKLEPDNFVVFRSVRELISRGGMEMRIMGKAVPIPNPYCSILLKYVPHLKCL